MKNKRLLGLLFVISLLAIAFFWSGNSEPTPLQDNEKQQALDAEQSVNDKELEEAKEEDKQEKPTKQEQEKDKDEEKKDKEQVGQEEKEQTKKEEPEVANDKTKGASKEQAVNTQDAKTETTEDKKQQASKSEQPKQEQPKQEQKKDKYLTDPVPEGKPKPVEWQDTTVDKNKNLTATLSVTSKTILNNMDKFNKDKLEVLPKDGVIYSARQVSFNEGESVFDVLLREMKKNKIHMEFEMTPIYNSNYVEGINNIYEFDCGELSGWMYKVNNWFPNYGSSRYKLKNGDVIEWIYTCDLGRDIGGDMAAGGNR